MSYDSDVVSATSGRGEANWDQIIKLCNRIRDSVGPTSMNQAMVSVMKRVKHSDPNVQLQALTLLEACVSNCGKDFQLEITKPSFHSDIRSIVTGSYSDPRVTQRTKDLLVSWANEFSNDQRMSALMRFIDQLKRDGISFQGVLPTTSPASRSQPPPSTSKVLQTREEEELKRAIQLSLQEAKQPSTTSTPSLYPSMTSSSTSSNSTAVQPKKGEKKVRAIYDFVAAEDNELSFRAGEIITLLDNSDENWWRGQTQLGSGLFPASFVSTDLSVDPEPSHKESSSKKKTSGVGKGKGTKAKGPQKVEVNEQQLDLLLEMIKTADVTSSENLAENETLLELEGQCKRMRPVIEERIAALQRQEDEMQAVNDKFQESLAMYRKLLAEGPRLSSAAVPQQPPPVSQQLPPTGHQPPPSITQPPAYQPLTVAGSNVPPTSVYSQQPMRGPSPHQPPSGTSWAHEQQQPPSLHSMTVQPHPQHQSVYTNPPASLPPHQPHYVTGGVPPAVSMPTQPHPPPYQPVESLYNPQQNTLLHQPLL